MLWLAFVVAFKPGGCSAQSGAATPIQLSDANPLATPEVGSYGLRALTPTLLELTLINTKDPDPATIQTWNFVGANFTANLPPASAFAVTANGTPVSIASVGFKRRPIYAPLKQRDLRVGNHLYLKLSSPIADGSKIEVKNPNAAYWPASMNFATTNDVLRFNPAIHVNQVGYMPAGPKKAMVGYYLGSMGELEVPTANGFKIIKASDNSVAFSGTLRSRLDVGYTYSPAPYQRVFEADFSSFATPGEYRLQVPGMGVSFPFSINEGTMAVFARAFALGMFHQRCGVENKIPFTRHEHEACHVNQADVPTTAFTFTQSILADVSSDFANEPRHTAPQLKNIESSRYPFVRAGKVDVSRGHHDAGDYSKYTINSAGLIHHLVFAADSFAGAGALDNLGLPESGDGKSDLLQEAKWEADFLAKMQDTDGGFYFLVYPKDRRYEDNVLPDAGDPQVVWPKTTAVTAAAVAALAEIGSSPRFKQQFPTEAALYMSKATLGWNFLMTAIARHGKDGAYQKLTHYGNEFMHDDELAWAAAAMFAATGNATYHAKLKEFMPDPSSTSVRRWGWWRMFEGWGAATRTYAFAVRSGRLASGLDAAYLAKCDAEIHAVAADHVRFAAQTSYGTSFPDLNKSYRSAGWYFSSERAFDITVAYQLSQRADYKEAVISNLNYEAGCNPVNVAYITGVGQKRQRDIVHQYAQNDRRILPPSGIPLGNVVAGFAYLGPYRGELTALSFPGDNVTTAPYPYYDRWADQFNTTAEFVVVDSARSLGSLAYWMAQSQVASQSWKSAAATITGLPATVPVDSEATISLSVPGVDMTGAQVVWEITNLEPGIGANYKFAPKFVGSTIVEAEAMLPDGRRVFAKSTFTATTSLNTPPNSFQSAPVAATAETVALYHLDGNLTDASSKQGPLTLAGNAKLDTSNLAWMATRAGGTLQFTDLADRATVSIPGNSLIAANTAYISLEAMIYVNEFKAYNRGNATIIALEQNDWSAYLKLGEDMYQGPFVKGGQALSYTGTALKNALTVKQWHHLRISLDRNAYTVALNGAVLSTVASADLANWNANTPIALKLGDIDGWIDEVVIKSSTAAPAPLNTPPTVTLSVGSGPYTAPATINLAATASDANGSVAKVEFFNGATKLGEDTSAPYAFSWTSVIAGTYSITAKATDNEGMTATTASANITVAATTGGGGGGTTGPSATFIKTDTTTKGNWRGTYGAEGYYIIGNATSAPAYGTATAAGHSEYIWSSNTSDPRALQTADGSTRVAAVWYSPTTFNVDFNFTDTASHRVAVYMMDWDNSGRAQRVEVLDAATGAILNTADVSAFSQGKYLVWDLKGRVRLRFTRTAGNNAVVEGIFFDVAPQTVTEPSLRPGGRNANGHFKVNVTGQVGATYTIQATENMSSWTNIGTVTMTAETTEFIDTNSSTGSFKFYRAR